MQKEVLNIDLSLTQEQGWGDLKSLFLNPVKVLVLTHKDPDGDAVGSALGIKWVLQRLGHSVDIILPDDSPSFLKWLPGHHDITIGSKKSEPKVRQLFEACDLIICADFNTPERLGAIEPFFDSCERTKILIDHHPANGAFAKFRLIDSTKGSTSELTYLLLEKLQLTPYTGAEGATCLLAGIMTDTVGLTVNCSYPEIFEIVAQLMRLGADKDRIQFEVYNQFSANRLRLLGYSLNHKMKIYPEYRAAYISLSTKELNTFHHHKGDTEGFVNFPLTISDVVFSVLFTEQSDHIKLSLRSRGSFPVNVFAQKYFNGGGHRNASGGRYFGTMEGAIQQFELALVEYNHLLHTDE